jgi:DNA-directed RNA polymerase specialized sigma24 family protein
MTDPSKISELIERSSLGTDGARGLRGRTPPEVAQRILDRAAEHERARDRATADPSSVADLLREICDGDPAAWDEIICRYGKLVSTTVRSFRLHEADTLDAVQMTWLRLIENANRIQFPERLGGWLVATARRECLRILRQAKSGPNLTDAVLETIANPSEYPELPTTDLTQTLWKFGAQKGQEEHVSSSQCSRRPLAAKINRLFETIHPPDRGPWSNHEVERGLAARAAADGDGLTISANYLRLLRNGQRDNPTLRNVQAMAKFFQVDPGYFLRDDHESEQLYADLQLLGAIRDHEQVKSIALRAFDLDPDLREWLERTINDLPKGRSRRQRNPGAGQRSETGHPPAGADPE